jgi:hypothetical protein
MKMASRIMGHVVDRDRRPIGNVQVHLKGKRVAESGADGFFSVTIARPESRVALTFTADGYVSNTRVYDSRATAMYGVVLWPVAYRVRFDPSRDLDVELGGSRIQVPANALAPATDLAVLRFTLFDITSPLQRAAAPGDFSGRMLDGSLRRLNSYGIFDLGVQDPGGRALGLRREARIDLAIAVPRRLSGNAPRQVGFFDFDTRPGLWNQIGTFELAAEALTYNGSVTSLGGAHNLDDPQDTVCVTLKVEDSNGQPVPNADIHAAGPCEPLQPAPPRIPSRGAC